MSSDSTKKVAKNTILLYIRMIVVMGVTFFTSRVILQSLGVTDYGVLNVVGGIAFSFGFFSSSLINATQRYLSFGHGKGDIDKVKEYFNLISLLYLLGIGLILIIAGSLGFWIVGRLNIPEELYWPGIVVYYTTLLSLLITLFASIFDSVLIARENMNFYAYISIVEAVLKLAIAYLIYLTPKHRLQIYSLLLLSVTIIVKGLLTIYCMKRFPECKFKIEWQPKKIRDIASFIGWNGLGTICWVINEQGVNILINIFFGPAVNAARGVVNQVNTAINNFTNNFFLALNPQIIKSYASGNENRCINMMFNASIFSFYLLWIICLPIIIRRNYILNIWLKDVPEYSAILLLWVLIYSLVNVLTKPQWTVVQAVGNLRQYIINGCVTMVAAIPVSYMLFKKGFAPQTVIIVLVIFRVFYVFISLFTLSHFIKFSILRYFKEIILPISAITISTYLIMNLINDYFPQTFVGLVAVSGISVIITMSLCFMAIGSKRQHKLVNMIIKRF